jgi:hypothetical protein
MKTLSMGTRRSSSAPAPGTINLAQRAILEPEEPPRDEACARTYFWARTSNYLWAMGAVAMGLGLHFYYVREMLASLALFSLLFFSVTAVVLSVFVVWYVGNQTATWAGPASRAVTAIFQQQGRGGIELFPVPVVEDGLERLQTQEHIGRKP